MKTIEERNIKRSESLQKSVFMKKDWKRETLSTGRSHG